MEKKNAWLTYDEATMAKVEAFAKAYCAYIDGGKTERECVALSVAASEEKGFKDLMKVVAEGGNLTAGDRVYVNWMNKCYLAFIVGSKPLCEGMNIVGAHIDSPRIDVKQ
ncbi:MAG: aminopeptidase, partial [Clostridia bacterium]|nr:aminopeptidase [Clostridia bacterium]